MIISIGMQWKNLFVEAYSPILTLTHNLYQFPVLFVIELLLHKTTTVV